MDFDGFDWDEGNWPKCGKHGVSKDEIEALFYVPSFNFAPDLRHSAREERWVGVGLGPISERWVLAIFTLRTTATRQRVRPISARFMHNKEMARYARSNPL